MTSVLDVNPTVRGIRPSASMTLAAQAARITEQMVQGVKKPFKKVIDVSSGDQHAAGLNPITFLHQVLAVCVYPELLHEDSLPLDVRQRAQRLLDSCNGGSVGSYCPTPPGISYVKKSIADFITRRDGGVSSDPENIIISRGSQSCLLFVLHIMASGTGTTRTGVLTPVPYPHTLPRLLDVCELVLEPYQLMEDRGWAVDLDELRRALKAARGRCKPTALFISNPGIPTGHVQGRESIEEVIGFAAAEGLVLLVQEAYQDSVCGHGREFISYKKVLSEMDEEYSDTVELISFNSLSNGSLSEGGLRGGYMEMINMDPVVGKYLKNIQGASSSPVLGQLALEVMVNPPRPGDASYETYTQEISLTYTTVSQNAQRACEVLNSLTGMSCQPAMGGVFLYPRLNLPPQMIDEAKVLGVEADVLYCQMLLEEEGVCLGAGSENRPHDNNYHIRLCVSAPTNILDEVLERISSFHRRLLNRFPVK
ncbi:alanine aminotransferase 2-like [Sphaeramia orbicularis]|uniref:alanine aminotransferase 2-like n=1 Tax=Sphaeramia orbicularis TaxID=375764 RepID=UPI00117D689E|nr:alanine aminotransferase 2-like [Sphaeramia orbicularis]